MIRHIETMIDDLVVQRYKFDWTSQPAGEALMRAETTWQGTTGIGAALASRLRLIKKIRFEITEDASTNAIGSRWMHTPSLGIHHTHIDAAGNALVNEEIISSAIDLMATNPVGARQQLRLSLGKAWDEELESFRYAGEGAPVRWLHNVG